MVLAPEKKKPAEAGGLWGNGGLYGQGVGSALLGSRVKS
jgi:hypothetical protein